MVRLDMSLTTSSVLLLVVPLLPATTLALSSDPAGAKNVGNAIGAQFIPGGCVSDADCASDCCAELAEARGVGVCSGPAVGGAAGKLGCGFVDADAAATIERARAQSGQ